MPRTLAIMTTLVFALLLHRAAHGDLVFEKSSVQLGRIKASGTIEHRFTFHTKDAPAEILEVKPSCGCLRTKLDKTLFAAGERGAIPMYIHTTSQAEGNKRFQLTIRVRDPIERTIVLVADASIESEIRVEPSNIIAQLDSSRSWKQTIALRDRRPRPARWNDVVASRPEIKAILRPASPDSRIRLVDLELIAPLPEGKHEERIEIRGHTTENPAFPDPLTIEVPITFVRPTAYSLMPERVAISQGDLVDGRIMRNVILIDRSRIATKATFTCGDNNIQGRCRLESAGVFKIRVEIHPGAKSTVAKIQPGKGHIVDLPIEIR